MRLADETITVFNARVDPGTGGEALCPTVIRGAGWYAADAEAVDPKGGLVAAGRIVIRIPEDADAGGKAYADPLDYARARHPEALWTLAGGSIVVRGAVSGGDWTEAGLKRTFADCCTVLSVTDNRRAPNAPHWRVVGA